VLPRANKLPAMNNKLMWRKMLVGTRDFGQAVSRRIEAGVEKR
jgi:hypothetical protein